ncbi:MAG: phosphoenolpyruvate carboxylase [Micavibrio aeruginosavorus]|uniref:Phosphoenolpyruvate carboxylase n=1 Tax=Micavibrio aeruginosavorus TaxID=349221 RepID=A0A2W4ZPY8_9BACT|nr:MAG: phosphoenolpyruvate carboxylase [Micavibrio aeruginosavorus]
MERLLALRYLEIVRKNDHDAHRLLQEKIAFHDYDPAADTRSAKNARMKGYRDFWDRLTVRERLILSGHDAKLNQMLRMARTIGTSEVVYAHNQIETTTAGSIDFVMRRFREENVAPEQVQKFLDENAVAWFSLTGHPTNPTTLEYTAAQTAVARVLTDPSSDKNTLDDVLQALYETPIVGDRKTPLDETREMINTLNVIYDMALPHLRLFEKALEKHGYAAEGVKIHTPLISPCVWTLGDGDGNENMTDTVLEEGISLHRHAVTGRYIETLRHLYAKTKHIAKTHSALKRFVPELESIANGDLSRFPDGNTLAAEIVDIANGIDTYECGKEIKDDILDFAYLIRCFGLGFGTIDLRHNAADITATAICYLKAAGYMTDGDVDMDSLQILLARTLEADALPDITADKMEQAGSKIESVILERMRVIGRHPDMCEKLIIAEAAHPAHALAALLLLKASGNTVCKTGSRIDITVLSESVHDLMGLGNTLETLLENKSFRAHVSSRGRLIAMIAKSDTTRQDGRGEAEYAQYEASVDIYRVVGRMRRKYPEMQDVLTSIMNGGGHALQRGGGRVTEIPAVHGRAAADARVTDCGPSTLTVQGQQLGILFCPGKVALGTLEALAAQNLYTKAGINGEMPETVADKNMNRQYARSDAWLYAKTAGLAFEALAKNNPAIDNLLSKAPWLSMKAGNVSSRPGKRGEKMVGPGITPMEAKGKDPKALQGRAISGERLTAHACLPVFSVLGLLEAMETVRGQGRASLNEHKYGDALHHLYRTHKIHRDGTRATINAVTMADFDIAWRLLVGRSRPAPQEVYRLSTKFKYNAGSESNTPEITLAFMEQYFLQVEKISYEMISGQKAKKNFRHGDGLKKLWPELYNEVAYRERAAEFARVIECYRTEGFNSAPDVPLDLDEYRITQSLYTAADVINAPVGILATRTRLEPVYELRGGVKTKFMKPESYLEGDVAGILKLPPCLE